MDEKDELVKMRNKSFVMRERNKRNLRYLRAEQMISLFSLYCH